MRQVSQGEESFLHLLPLGTSGRVTLLDVVHLGEVEEHTRHVASEATTNVPVAERDRLASRLVSGSLSWPFLHASGFCRT